MKILFICGVTDAGKSTTIRRSIQFLNVDSDTKSKFLKNRNPPKIIDVDGKSVCVYLDSPQEATTGPDKAIKYLKDKIAIAQKYNAELLVLAFNILFIHDGKTDVCLRWLNANGYKPSTFFAYLDSNIADDVSARVRIGNMRNDGFNILPTIKRSTPDEQGEKFANYIRQLL